MNIVIFLIILALLVLAHEFGHFIIAKKNGVRVDEFGLGFPPRLFGKKIGETIYSVNVLPFGGFVKIFGENAESLESPDGKVEDKSRSLMHKSRFVQAAVLSGGVLFNIIFAWLIISLGLMIGLPTGIDESNAAFAKNPQLVITGILPNSPAEKSSLHAGDIVTALQDDTKSLTHDITPNSVREFIANSQGQIKISYKRGTKTTETNLEAQEGIVSAGKAIGISMDMVGIVQFPIEKAVIEGGRMTGRLFQNVAISIFQFFSDALFGHADLTQVAGPVGMVALVGDARELGFAYLIFFTALLSINLAVINLIPFPALDGGRLLMVLIEAIKGSPIKPTVVQTINTVGFGLLILLMLVVTYHDIVVKFF